MLTSNFWDKDIIICKYLGWKTLHENMTLVVIGFSFSIVYMIYTDIYRWNVTKTKNYKRKLEKIFIKASHCKSNKETSIVNSILTKNSS